MAMSSESLGLFEVRRKRNGDKSMYNFVYHLLI